MTFETPAAPIERALEGLSSASKTQLRFAPLLKNEFLLIRVQDAPLQQVMDRIAEAVHGEWQSESDGFRLIRSAKTQRELEQLHDTLEAKRFRDAIEKVKGRVAAERPLDENEARSVGAKVRAMLESAKELKGENVDYRAQQSLMSALPGGRLAARITCLLDPRTLGQMSDPGKVVFSTSPTRMQLPMPRGGGELIAAYARERALMQAAIRDLPDTDMSGMPWELTTLLNARNIKNSTVAKALVEVRTWEFASNAMVTVKLANSSGRVIESSNCSLDLDESMGPQPEPPGKDPSGAAPLELSKSSQELAQAFASAMAQRANFLPQIPESVKPILYEPEKHTLSELVLSDLLLGTARAKKLNVVAAPTDIFGFFSIALFAAGAPSADQFLSRMRKPIFDMELREAPGWLVLRTTDPVKAKRLQFDRVILGRLVRKAAQSGKVMIDDLASLAASTSEDFERMAALIYMMIAVPNSSKELERSNWQILRLHGMLSLDQKRVLESGRKISYASLTPELQRIFNRIVFEDLQGVSRTRTAPEPALRAEEDESEGLETIKWEPSERYPNGLDARAMLSLGIDSGPRILASGLYQGEHRTSNTFSIEDFAMQMVSKENPEATWAHNTVYNEFAFVRQRKLNYGFEADPANIIFGELEESLETSPTVSSMEKLPPDIWKQIQDEMNRIRQAMKPRRPPPSQPLDAKSR